MLGSRRLFTLAAALTCAACALPATAGATTPANVKAAMSQLSGASGAYAYDITDGTFIASRNGGARRILASNTKLFTTAGVLSRFGTGGRFSTGVYTNGTVAGGILTGDLFLRGGGDPLFGTAGYVTKNFGSTATVENLAAGLKALGITKVTGRVYGDQGIYDLRRGTAPYGFGVSSEIGGMLGGLILNKGFNGNKWQSDPARFAAQRLRLAIRRAGIVIGTKTGRAATPTNAHRLTSVRSLPMSAIVRQMDKPSNNYLAEMLVKSLALPIAAADDDADGGQVPLSFAGATTSGGDSIARTIAAAYGSKVTLQDGSGLSRKDKASPREVVDLLRGIQKTVAYSDFRAALPIAGVDGTLANRMKATAAKKRCSAKTGTLSNVSALSGWCTTVGGDTVAFSILQNKVGITAAHNQQDRIAAAIAGLN